MTSTATAPPIVAVAPFVVLLVAIAVLPLVAPRVWHSNRNKLVIAAVLGLPILVMYLVRDPGQLVAMAEEYVSFVVMLAGLYVIAGGIRLTGDLRATPLVNAAFLALGAALASFIGTTGASMLLVRPLIQTNQERARVRHTIVFFIFLVSNVGGMLTPLGDPPLFLGYLRGVPFAWTFRLWPHWLLMVVVTLAGFCILGLQFGLNAASAMIYPTSVRSNGSGWAFGVGRFGSILGPIFGGKLIALKLSVPMLFLIAAIPFVLGTAACVALAVLYSARFKGAGLGERGSAASPATS